MAATSGRVRMRPTPTWLPHAASMSGRMRRPPRGVSAPARNEDKEKGPTHPGEPLLKRAVIGNSRSTGTGVLVGRDAAGEPAKEALLVRDERVTSDGAILDVVDIAHATGVDVEDVLTRDDAG